MLVGLVAPAAAAALPDARPVDALPSAWEAPPLVLFGAAVAVALFAQAFWRLRRRGRADAAAWWRVPVFVAGVALGVLPLLSPLDAIGDSYLLSGHMLQHVLIGDAAPALIVLALRGPLVFFVLPATVLRRLAGVRPLRALLSFVLRPWITFMIWVAVLLGWHVPAAFDYTLSHQTVHDLEHVTFVVAGTLAWVQLIDPARHARLRPSGRILFAIGMLALSHPIIDGLLFSARVVYRPYALQPERLLGLSALTDQRIAAGVMMVEQLLTLGTCIAVLAWPYVQRRRARRAAAVSQGAS
jgi:cytochrome c oxidase assembly factor CtaG